MSYFAYRNFSISDEVDVPYRNSDNTTYNSITYVINDWEADTSIWTDSEVVARKFVLPIDVKCLNPIDIRITYRWYSNNGYVYFDPDIRLI